MLSWVKIRKLKLKYFPLCENCGLDKCLHIHHIIPRVLNGKNWWGNLQTLCTDCHRLIHKYLNRKESAKLLKQKMDKKHINWITQYHVIAKLCKKVGEK